MTNSEIKARFWELFETLKKARFDARRYRQLSCKRNAEILAENTEVDLAELVDEIPEESFVEIFGKYADFAKKFRNK